MIRNSVRSYRGSVGWRGEPHRHYLAAKGIRTRPVKRSIHGHYLVDYKRGAERLKAIFHDGSPDVNGTDMREMVVDNLRNEVRGELDKSMREDSMSFSDAQQFMDDDFSRETKHFLQSSKPDRTAYEGEVRRRLQRHKEMFSRGSGR